MASTMSPDHGDPVYRRRWTTVHGPAGGDPHLVDWVDYEDRMSAAEPEAFAAELHERAGQGTVWLVWSQGYRTLGRKCERSVDALKVLRPGGQAVVPSGGEFEHMWLYQYGPVPE